jgi:hypothetical protein
MDKLEIFKDEYLSSTSTRMRLFHYPVEFNATISAEGWDLDISIRTTGKGVLGYTDNTVVERVIGIVLYNNNAW